MSFNDKLDFISLVGSYDIVN